MKKQIHKITIDYVNIIHVIVKSILLVSVIIYISNNLLKAEQGINSIFFGIALLLLFLNEYFETISHVKLYNKTK